MKKILVVLISVFVLTVPCMAQNVKAESKANIRALPQLDSRIVDTLQVGETAELLSKRTRSGYYHVRIKNHREGWVHKSAVTITEGPVHDLAAFTAHLSKEDRAHRLALDASDAQTHQCGHIANADACHSSFAEGCTLSDKPNTYDAYLNYFKNLTPSPDNASSQIISILTSLSDFQKFDHSTIELGLGKKRQVNFSPDLADIGEGNIYSVVGYLYYAIPGGIETSNCKLKDVDDRDYHIGIGFDPEMANDIATGTITIAKKDTDTDPIKQVSVIVEMTPHYRNEFHENWTLPRVQELAGRQVKIVGQLIVDNEHNDAGQNCAFPDHDESSCWRASAWEIHPVTSFYVCTAQKCTADSDTGWTELDAWSED